MFRGINTVSVDAKNRLALPSKTREILRDNQINDLVMTLNPWDRSIWLYPLHEWVRIEEKLSSLNDLNTVTRRTKQIMRGYATDVSLDANGRFVISTEMIKLSKISDDAVVLGQGNKIEIWDSQRWSEERDKWLEGITGSDREDNSSLSDLSL